MKKIIFLGFLLGFASLVVAQNRVRIGFMDMDRVLENLNDYKDANAALEAAAPAGEAGELADAVDKWHHVKL